MTLPNTNTPNGCDSSTTSSSLSTTTTTNIATMSSSSLLTSSSLCSTDDSDMFGPPRVSPPIGYHHHRSRVPMISPKLRQREERKRILQLCAHKLERIKDSEANLRRSVCINNTYCRLTDELRREKQMRYLQNLPKIENNPETAREIIFDHNLDDTKLMQKSLSYNSHNDIDDDDNDRSICEIENQPHHNFIDQRGNGNNVKSYNNMNMTTNTNISNLATSVTAASVAVFAATAAATTSSAATTTTNNIIPITARQKRHISNNNLVNDLEILDRELSAINAPMPLIDPEITQGAEQLEKAISSRKRTRNNEDESDRLVREALQQFYIPPQRLISAIEDCPLDVIGLNTNSNSNNNNGLGLLNNNNNNSSSSNNNNNSSNHMNGVGVGVVGNILNENGLNGVGGLIHHNPCKRAKLNTLTAADLDLDFVDINQNQKDFEVIMDALRLGTPNSTTATSMSSSDSCGQAAMMSESANVFHNLVVTSLET